MSGNTRHTGEKMHTETLHKIVGQEEVDYQSAQHYPLTQAKY
jgi:hypothetical protein